MEVQRDFQLLDDDDDIGLSQIMTTSLYESSTSNKTNSSIRIQHKGLNSTSSITVNNNNKISNSLTNLNSSDTIKSRPRSSKFNISPNNPNANNTNKLDLKSIERPRSHSPLKMKGIEEYIQLYANNKLNLSNKKNSNMNSSSNVNANKITMNLKMDDLLANVKNDSNSYQTLSDFSFMTGDSDVVTDTFTGKPRRRSLNSANLKDDDWLNNKANNLKELNSKNKDDSIDNEADDDDNDEEDDDVNANQDGDIFSKGNNLNYKYTASYKKDEATGSFKEQSKIIFESKLKPKVPPPPPSLQQQTQSPVTTNRGKININNFIDQFLSFKCFFMSILLYLMN